MKINFEYLFISCLVALVAFIGLFAGTTFFESVKVEFDSSAQKDFEYAVFWKEKIDDTFSAANRTAQSVSSGKHHIKFFLPTKQLAQFRIDFGVNPGNVVVSNLKINGEEVDFSAFTPNPHIQDFKKMGTEWHLSSSQEDPFIVSEKVYYTAQEHITFIHIMWVLFGIYALYMMMEMMFNVAKEPNKKRGFFNIEFLRILFTLMVVISHTLSRIDMPSAAGGYAVEFFFVLSGFFLIWTFGPDKSIQQSMIKKYLMWTPLIVFGGILAGGGWESFRGLFYLQNTGLAKWSDIPNAPAWYLAVLFWGTLFYLGLMKTMKDGPRHIVIGCLIFIMSILIQLSPTGGRLELALSSIPVGVLRGIVDMGCGYFLAIGLRQMNTSDIKKSPRIWSVLEVGLFTWLVVSPFVSEWRTGSRILIPVAMAGLIFLFILKRGILSRLLDRPAFVKLAKPCLAVYLTHWTVTQVLLPKWVNLGITQKYGNSFAIVMAVVTAWILGTVSYLIIEKPCNRILLKRFIKINKSNNIQNSNTKE